MPHNLRLLRDALHLKRSVERYRLYSGRGECEDIRDTIDEILSSSFRDEIQLTASKGNGLVPEAIISSSEQKRESAVTYFHVSSRQNKSARPILQPMAEKSVSKEYQANSTRS